MTADASRSDTLTSLRANLQRAGRETHLLPLSGDAVALLLPHGGRVLGLFPGIREANFLWTHPALLDAHAADSVFANPHWINPGGDRTWVAPEHEWFIADLARPGETYRPPRTLDPAAYTLYPRRDAAHMTTRAVLRSHRNGRETRVEIEKVIAPAVNPLSAAPGPWDGLRFAGYRSEITLRVEAAAGESPGPVGLWQLLQLPPGGDMSVATYGTATPRVLVNEVPSGHLRAEPGVLRYRMTDRTQTHKIGLPAIQTAGRAGYVRANADGTFNLVVRNFNVDPSGLYVDVPWNDLTATGSAFQACNVAERLVGHFAELEHHAPAVDGRTGSDRSVDVSHVWAYRGDAEAIDTAGRALLGRAVIPTGPDTPGEDE